MPRGDAVFIREVESAAISLVARSGCCASAERQIPKARVIGAAVRTARRSPYRISYMIVIRHEGHDVREFAKRARHPRRSA
jgi:hypothetical protein